MEGKELRKRREKLGLTQTALAEILEVKPNTVTRWENGVLSISKTVELAFERIETQLRENENIDRKPDLIIR